MSAINTWASTVVLLAAVLAVSACTSTPIGVGDSGKPGHGIDAKDTTASTDSGLGPIVYEEPPRAVCKKRRRTGTNRRVSVCEGMVGSQPVRTVTEEDSAIIWGSSPTGASGNN